MEERFTHNGCCLEWGPGGHYLIHCECDVQDQKQSIEQCQTRNRFWKYQGIILMIDTHYVIFFRTYLLPIAIFNKSRFIIPCCPKVRYALVYHFGPQSLLFVFTGVADPFGFNGIVDHFPSIQESSTWALAEDEDSTGKGDSPSSEAGSAQVILKYGTRDDRWSLCWPKSLHEQHCPLKNREEVDADEQTTAPDLRSSPFWARKFKVYDSNDFIWSI